ncbi:MAG: FAD-binding oxidoreductase [Gemmatimonadota bacterium]|jgi:glycolate oxidase FAD binding subunit
MTVAASLTDILPPEALSEVEPSGRLAALASGAEAVVRPRSTEEVVEVLRWATANEVGVLPVGSGERARRPMREGRFLVLSTDDLAGLEIYEPADVTFTAGAGTRLSEIASALAEHRQWLPFDPPHVPGRTLGGLVAAGESGPVATGYGALRNHVLGATVVSGDGRILHLGGRVVKNVAGFDLLRPLVGSRGRLGVITSVCVRAFPVPAEDRVLVLRAADVSELADAARGVRTAPVLPVSSVVCAFAGALGTGAALLGPGAALLVRLQGSASTVAADRSTLESHCGVTFDEPSDGAVALEEARDRVADGDTVLRVSLLPSRLFEGLAALRDALGEVSVSADAYGGMARVAVEAADAATVGRARAAVEALGGALRVASGHVDPAVVDAGSRPSPEEVDLASRVEQVFDPAGVLWPCRR